MKKMLLISFIFICLFCYTSQIFAAETSGELKIELKMPEVGEGYENCKELLGNSLSTLVKTFRILLQIGGVAICLVNGMLGYAKAIVSKNSDEIYKATMNLGTMLCILVAIVLLPTLIRVLVRLIGGYDLSCL